MIQSDATKLWFVSELYYPEETSTGYYLTAIAEGLAPHYPVQVLCGQPSYSPRGSDAPGYEHRRGVKIRRCQAITLNKDIFFLRLLSSLTIGLSIFFHALWHLGKNDIVFVVTNPPLLPFFTLGACRLRRAKCVLLIHDVYPDTMIAAGMLSECSAITHLLNFFNKTLYKSVDRIGVLGRDMEALVKKKLEKVYNQQIFITRCWADVTKVLPSSRNQNTLLKQSKLLNKFVVQYAGNIGRVQGVENLFEAAKQLNKKNKNIHFLIIGSGAKKKWLENSIKKDNLQNCAMLQSMSRKEQQTFLNACDVAVVLLVPKMLGVAVPSRIYNILASGKPIIAAIEDESDMAQIIREENIGWVVPPDQPDRLVEAIFEAYSNRDRLAAMGARARSVVENRFIFQSVIHSYRELINSFDLNLCD